MKSGMLTGAMTRERIARMPDDDFRKRNPNFNEPLLTRNLALAERLPPSAIVTAARLAKSRWRGPSAAPK